MSARRATCACGQLTAVCVGEPMRVSVCHCLACQQRTGSAFGAKALFARDKVTLEGNATEFVRVGDEGCRITFRFCPTCGTTLTWVIDARPDAVSVALGAFADPSFPAPWVAVYEHRRHPWVSVSLAEGENVD
jgi:hypothetical protein